MGRAASSDLLSADAVNRLVELSQRSAADDASAALREALALAGADVIGDREIEALYELLERIDHQSRILQRRFDQLQGRYQLASADGRGGEPREALRAELVVMRSRLKRLHIAACLAETLAYAGSDGATSRVRALEARLVRVEAAFTNGTAGTGLAANVDGDGSRAHS